jgi:hypothetical protein
MNPQPSFSWRQWRMGLAVAVAAAVLNSGVAYSAGGSLKVIIGTFCTSLMTVGPAYLKQHPIEEIQDSRLTKPIFNPSQNTAELPGTYNYGSTGTPYPPDTKPSVDFALVEADMKTGLTLAEAMKKNGL